MPQPLEVNDLHKYYGSLKAVQGVDFDVRPGEVFGLLGPNGAGKTSIISTIVTLEKPTKGHVSVFGHDVQKEPQQAKVDLGLVPQELVNHGFFNIEEILQFHSGYYGVRHNKEHCSYLMKRLGLWEHRHKKVKQLSGGMKRRLLIAKALVHKPRLLLLDEPTAGVDIELRSSLWEFVRELKSDGVSVLLTTHYLEEAEELCDRVGILNFGQLLKVGPTNELVSELTRRTVRVFLQARQVAFSHSLLLSQTDEMLEFEIPSTMSVGDLLSTISLDLKIIKDITIQEGTLEEAFIRILSRSRNHG